MGRKGEEKKKDAVLREKSQLHIEEEGGAINRRFCKKEKASSAKSL